MRPDELKMIGQAFLPDHCKSKWRHEIARLTDYSERMVRYWHEQPARFPVPPLVEKVIRLEYRKLQRRQGRREE